MLKDDSFFATFLTKILITQSWGWGRDCRVHPYKHSWIFQKWLKHGFEVFLLLIFIIWGHSLKISDMYLYFCRNYSHFGEAGWTNLASLRKYNIFYHTGIWRFARQNTLWMQFCFVSRICDNFSWHI